LWMKIVDFRLWRHMLAASDTDAAGCSRPSRHPRKSPGGLAVSQFTLVTGSASPAPIRTVIPANSLAGTVAPAIHASGAASAHILPRRNFAGACVSWPAVRAEKAQRRRRSQARGLLAMSHPGLSAISDPWTFGNFGFSALRRVDVTFPWGQTGVHLLLRRAPQAPAHYAVPLITEG
jgi:hypothetical protein